MTSKAIVSKLQVHPSGSLHSTQILAPKVLISMTGWDPGTCLSLVLLGITC